MLQDFQNTQAGNNSIVGPEINIFCYSNYCNGVEMVGDTNLLNTTLCWVEYDIVLGYHFSFEI